LVITDVQLSDAGQYKVIATVKESDNSSVCMDAETTASLTVVSASVEGLQTTVHVSV
jgi:hypothetical protein